MAAAVALIPAVDAQCPHGGRECYYSLSSAYSFEYRVAGDAHNNDCGVGFM